MFIKDQWQQVSLPHRPELKPLPQLVAQLLGSAPLPAVNMLRLCRLDAPALYPSLHGFDKSLRVTDEPEMIQVPGLVT